MPSMKGLAVGVGAVLIVGYLALKTGAARGLSDISQSVTQAVAAPFTGLGTGLSSLAGGVSALFSPTVAPTIAPIFDWSGWKPFGNGNGRTEDRDNGNGLKNGLNGGGGGARTEDRNGGKLIPILSGPAPNGVYKPSTSPSLPGYTPRPEDRRSTGIVML